MHEAKSHVLNQSQHSTCQTLRPLFTGCQIGKSPAQAPRNRTI